MNRPELFTTPVGMPSVRLGPEALDDPLDPTAGARAFVGPEQLAGFEHVVLFGAGLGYRVQRLAELGVREPIVFEPCPETIELAKHHGPGLPEGAVVFTELELLHAYLLERTQAAHRTLLLHAPPYARAFPMALGFLSQVVAEVQGLSVLRKNSVDERSALLVERLLTNLWRLEQTPTLGAVGSPLDGVPAFIVSAGPSLDRNRHLLSAASDRGAVFAVNTSAPVFDAVEAPIDLLFAIEALDVSEPMMRARDRARGLAVDLTANGANFEVGIEPVVTFAPAAPQFVPICSALGFSPLPYGGSVATAAFAAALSLGADPIVLVGQDLAYPEGRGYAADTLFEHTRVQAHGDLLVIDRVAKWEEMTRRGGLPVPSKLRPRLEAPAWGGGTVDTTHELTAFRRWFEGAAAQLRGLRRFVNATEGGASIRGFEERCLEDILESLPTRAHGLTEAVAASPTTSPRCIRSTLREIAKNARRVEREARRAERAAKRGDVSTLRRGEVRVRNAAAGAPLVDAYSTADLNAILEDEALQGSQRTARVYGAIATAAAAVARHAEPHVR